MLESHDLAERRRHVSGQSNRLCHGCVDYFGKSAHSLLHKPGGNGHKLSLQRFVRSFGLSSVTYDWLIVAFLNSLVFIYLLHLREYMCFHGMHHWLAA